MMLPQLKLMAAVFGVRCLRFACDQLHGRTLGPQHYFWTDSQCVIAWLTSDHHLPVFVNNCVKMIRQHPAIVRYCGTTDNPADIPSCGTRTAVPANDNKWWHGPEWLTLPETDWLTRNVEPQFLQHIRSSSQMSSVIFETRLTAVD